jgi:hypothetical protein
MLKIERMALELLEFKVDALAKQRTVRGGVSDLWALQRAVERGVGGLDSDERDRLADVSRRLRALAELPTTSNRRPATDLDALRIDGGQRDGVDHDALLDTEAPRARPTAEAGQEQQVLLRLAERIWREELDESLARLAAAWRAERDRLTPRLIYTTMRNLRRHAEQRDAAVDASLRGFRVVEPLAEPEDPLVSLSDLDSLAEVGRDLVQLILTLGTPASPLPRLEIPAAQALPFVRQAMLTVAQDPYAGRLSPIVRRGPTTTELRTAMMELAKERLPEAQRAVQRRELEVRLGEALAFERHARQTFQRDVGRHVEAVQALFERLDRHLPARVGGSAPPPRLAGGVLMGMSTALRWERVPQGADALTLRMVGPVRFTLGGQEVAVMGAGESRTLFVNEVPHPLSSRLVVSLPGGALHVDRDGEYLHVRWRDGGRSLAAHLAEALVQAYALSHDRHADLLEVLSGVAGLAGGIPENVVARPLTPAGEVTAKAPNRRAAIEGLVRGAAAAVGANDLDDHVLLGLVQRLQAAMTVEAGDLAGLLEREEDSDGAVHPVSEDPVTADVGTLKLTVRSYRPRSKSARAQLVVMLPGQVVGSFTETMVESVRGGVLVGARGEDEFALVFLRGRALRGRRAAVARAAP